MEADTNAIIRVYNVSAPPVFYVLSDVHSEMRSDAVQVICSQPRREVPAGAPRVLLLAGDVGYVGTPEYNACIQEAAITYDCVCVVTGNHEYWQSRKAFEDVDTQARAICAKYSNVILLQKNGVQWQWTDADGTARELILVGCTLWTDVNPEDNGIRHIIRDYRRIKVRAEPGPNGEQRRQPLYPRYIHALNADHVQFLSEMTSCYPKSTTRSLVAMTHHVPLKSALPADFDIPSAYAASCDALVPQFSAWIHGHVHVASDTVVSGCRIVANPLGYPDEKNTGHKCDGWLWFA